MEDLRNIYMGKFLDILEPSDIVISGNKIKKWYVNFCNEVLNVYDEKWLINNRQEFIGRLREEYEDYEKINKKTFRSLGWMLKVNDEYNEITTRTL